MKTIAVTGATGAQGGSVVQVLLATKQWKVRAITRNVNSLAAKTLKDQGVEVVTADFNNEESLVKAFQGANAVFAMTNYWEQVLAHKKTLAEAAVIEENQGVALANAAAKTATLEHYIWSTLPEMNELSEGKINVPHCDCKARVDAYIRQNLPTLAAKTTYLWMGFYPSNMAYFPIFKPFKMPQNDNYIFLLPPNTSAQLPITGDITRTAGLWVRRILENPQTTYGRVAGVMTVVVSLDDVVKAWSKALGKPAVIVECSESTYEALWGFQGKEFSTQLQFHHLVPDLIGTFNKKGNHGKYISAEELGISIEETGNMIEIFQSLKDHWD